MKTQKQSRFCLPLLFNASASLAAGGEVSNQKFRVQGYERLVGSFHATTASAAGFPRIRQSADGVTWSLVYVILADGTQADFQYPFDIKVRFPYVSVEYIQGAAPSGAFLAWAEARPE